MKITQVGLTENSLPIFAYHFGRAGQRVLILGGVHGDEVEGVVLAQGILSRLLRHDDLSLRLTLIPTFNLDGVC